MSGPKLLIFTYYKYKEKLLKWVLQPSFMLIFILFFNLNLDLGLYNIIILGVYPNSVIKSDCTYPLGGVFDLLYQLV